MGPYKSRTTILNPTEEKPVCTQSKAHILDMSITNEEKKNDRAKVVCLPWVPEPGCEGGTTPLPIPVGAGVFSGFPYSSLLCPPGPWSTQMSHLVGR